MGFKNDLTGKVFGRLTVIEFSHNGSNWSVYWKCRCSCGAYIVVRNNNLLSGNTKSCGCQKLDSSRAMCTVHNLRRHPLYNVWAAIKQRCNNPQDKNFHYYGGRGIKLCDAWNNSFVDFYNWAIGNGYQKGLTVDRINNDGNYEPANCRLVYVIDQHNNTRSNRYLTYMGRTLTMAQWARELGIDYRRLQSRINLGWDMDRIVAVGNRKANVSEIIRPTNYKKKT